MKNARLFIFHERDYVDDDEDAKEESASKNGKAGTLSGLPTAVVHRCL